MADDAFDDFSAPAEENNIQPRKVRRRSPRRLLKALAFLAVCGGLVAIVVYSPLFTLQRLVVNGNSYLKADEVMQIAHVYRGEPLYQLETAEVTQHLLRDLRIESATVHRRIPDTLEIDIVERRPIATVACDLGYVDFDRQGKAIACYKGLKSMAIPVITGVSVHDIYIGDDNADPNVADALKLLAGLDETALNQISELSLAASGVALYTTNAVQIKLGNFDRLEEKIKLINSFLKELPESKHKIEYVDFSYTAPVIRLRDLPIDDEVETPDGAQ